MRGMPPEGFSTRDFPHGVRGEYPIASGSELLAGVATE